MSFTGSCRIHCIHQIHISINFLMFLSNGFKTKCRNLWCIGILGLFLLIPLTPWEMPHPPFSSSFVLRRKWGRVSCLDQMALFPSNPFNPLGNATRFKIQNFHQTESFLFLAMVWEQHASVKIWQEQIHWIHQVHISINLNLLLSNLIRGKILPFLVP